MWFRHVKKEMLDLTVTGISSSFVFDLNHFKVGDAIALRKRTDKKYTYALISAIDRIAMSVLILTEHGRLREVEGVKVIKNNMCTLHIDVSSVSNGEVELLSLAAMLTAPAEDEEDVLYDS